VKGVLVEVRIVAVGGGKEVDDAAAGIGVLGKTR
jgi:hypothetical protein